MYTAYNFIIDGLVGGRRMFRQKQPDGHIGLGFEGEVPPQDESSYKAAPAKKGVYQCLLNQITLV